MAIAGGCLCRAVRFEINADGPLGARYCWCRVCQYLGAGTGAVSAIFRKEDVAVSGPLTDYVSGPTAARPCTGGSAPDAARPSSARRKSARTVIFVRAGTLDDPDLAAPTATIWTKSAPEWACFDLDLPQDGRTAAAASKT